MTERNQFDTTDVSLEQMSVHFDVSTNQESFIYLARIIIVVSGWGRRPYILVVTRAGIAIVVVCI